MCTIKGVFKRRKKKKTAKKLLVEFTNSLQPASPTYACAGDVAVEQECNKQTPPKHFTPDIRSASGPNRCALKRHLWLSCVCVCVRVCPDGDTSAPESRGSTSGFNRVPSIPYYRGARPARMECLWLGGIELFVCLKSLAAPALLSGKGYA